MTSSEAEGKLVSKRSNSATKSSEGLEVKLNLTGLLPIRERPAHLTGRMGHAVYRKFEDVEYHGWGETYVKIRAKTARLSTAICRVTRGPHLGKTRGATVSRSGSRRPPFPTSDI